MSSQEALKAALDALDEAAPALAERARARAITIKKEKEQANKKPKQVITVKVEDGSDQQQSMKKKKKKASYLIGDPLPAMNRSSSSTSTDSNDSSADNTKRSAHDRVAEFPMEPLIVVVCALVLLLLSLPALIYFFCVLCWLRPPPLETRLSVLRAPYCFQPSCHHCVHT
jgi:cobalamin biosynthesis Mg chelatase CobN